MINAQKDDFVMCDLDVDLQLDENPDNIKYLPEECQNLTKEEKELLTMEAENFKSFYEKLTKYESGLGLDSDEEIYKDWDFRDELYTNAEIHLCRNSTEILQEYVDCMVDKRNVMMEKIDEKIAANSVQL